MADILPFPGRGVNLARAQARKTISIEHLLIWAYRDMRVQSNRGLYEVEARADDYEWYGRSSDGVAAMMDIGRIGCRIQGGGTTYVREIGDHDVVDEAVRSLLNGFEQALVITNAMTGSAPDWKPGARHRMGPWGFDKLAKDIPAWGAKAGEHWAMVEHTDEEKGPGRPYCPVRECDNPQIVDHARKQYARWVLAVASVHEVLAAGDVLRKHILTDQLPHPEPWGNLELARRRSVTLFHAPGGV